MAFPNLNNWKLWEIPLGIATGGQSAMFHGALQAMQNVAQPVGDAIGTAAKKFGSDVADKGMAYNSAEAQKQRDWEEYMSNTAIQRQVEDIKKAGLNPWLALNGGSAVGASVGSGASASFNSSSAQVSALTKTNETLINALTKLSTSAISVIGNLTKLV